MSRGTKIRSIRIPDYLVEAAVKRGEEVMGTKVLSNIVREALREWLNVTEPVSADTDYEDGVTVTWDA